MRDDVVHQAIGWTSNKLLGQEVAMGRHPRTLVFLQNHLTVAISYNLEASISLTLLQCSLQVIFQCLFL